MKIYILFILLIIDPWHGLAQTPSPQEKPQIPTGPLIQKRGPEFSRWSISVKLLGDKKEGDASGPNPVESAPEPPPKTVVTKTGNIIQVRVVDAQKTVWEIWCQGSMSAVISPQGGRSQLVAPTGSKDAVNPLFFDFSRTDFPGFEWISAANFQGIRKFRDRSCLVFEDNVLVTVATPVKTDDANELTVDTYDSRVACIDAESRLPVALTNADGISIYRFLTPPSAMQTLPESVRDMLIARQKSAKMLQRIPHQPF